MHLAAIKFAAIANDFSSGCVSRGALFSLTGVLLFKADVLLFI